MPYRIFLVEDHPIMRLAYASALAREKDMALCGTAESAEEALEMLKETVCDLLIADVSLPGMDGFTLIKHLRNTQPDLPVVVISGHEEALLGDRMLRAGAQAFLSKKGLAPKLAPMLRQVLSNGSSRHDVQGLSPPD